MHDEALRVEVTDSDRITLVIVTGEIDAGTSPALQAPLAELSPQSHVVLDMSGVRFLDCRGLNVVLAQRTKMAEAGGSIRIRHGSPAVRRILHATGLTEAFREPDTPVDGH